MKQINVLSLFDGVSCGKLAFEKANINVGVYYASEVETVAIEVSKANYPNIEQLGNVLNWRSWTIDWGNIDFLIGGSPCQGFSFAGKQLNFEDSRSKLFFVFVDILNHINEERHKLWKPKVKFMLENVRMKQEYSSVISKYLNCKPVFIDAELISPCRRPRNYWFNFKCEPLQKQPSNLSDFIQDDFKNPCNIVGRRINPHTGKRDDYNRSIPIIQYLHSLKGSKARCVTTVNKDCLLTKLPEGLYPNAYTELAKDVHWREPSIQELCLFHGIPIGYFNSITDSKARKLIGNGWNVDVVAHIFSNASF